MHGISFREYLAFEGIITIPAVSLGDLLTNHQRIAMDITANVRVLGHFDAYLKYGYYPFYKIDGDGL